MISKTKSKIQVKEYIKNGYNATKTIKALEPNINPEYAKLKGFLMINSANFKKTLQEIMQEEGITNETISKILKRNITQDKNLPASNGALDMAIKVRGDYSPEKKITLNLTPQQRDERIMYLLEQLKDSTQLKPQDPNNSNPNPTHP